MPHLTQHIVGYSKAPMKRLDGHDLITSVNVLPFRKSKKEPVEGEAGFFFFPPPRLIATSLSHTLCLSQSIDHHSHLCFWGKDACLSGDQTDFGAGMNTHTHTHTFSTPRGLSLDYMNDPCSSDTCSSFTEAGQMHSRERLIGGK